MNTAPGSPLDALAAAHEQLRQVIALSAQLGTAGPDQAAGLAATIRRFFAEELALHEADEDLSLASLLREVRAPDDVLQALDVVARQHPDIDRVVGRLVPLWQSVADDPAALPALAARLIQASERLAGLWEPHLSLEEATLFPAARRLLGPEHLERLAAECAQRRA